MSALPPRFSPLVPALSLMALVLMAQTVGSEQRFGGSSHRQQTSQVAGRGSAQTAPPPQGRGQTPPGPSQGGQRPQPNAEQFLTPRYDWWKDEAVKKELKLTDLQVRRITGIVDGRVREVTPFWEEFQKQMLELDRLTKERTVDMATYTVQVNRAEGLRSKLNETRTVMLYRILRELDVTQYQKLGEILDRRRSGRGGGPSPRTW